MQTIDLTDAVEATARAEYQRATSTRPGSLPWESCPEQERATYRIAVRPHVEAAAPLIAARALQDAATAFATTRPTETARRSLEYPMVELQAMACRHTAPQHLTPTAPAGAMSQAAGRSTGSGALRRTRSTLSALRTARTPQAA